MSLQHKKAQWLSRWHGLLTTMVVGLIMGLVACGGGGGGGDDTAADDIPSDETPDDGSSQGLLYTGNTNPASITTTNASELISELIGGTDVTDSVPLQQPQTLSEPAVWDGVIPAVDTLSSHTLDLASSDFGKQSSEYTTAAIVPLEETLPCDSGSTTLSGLIDDQTGTGTVTVTFNECTFDGETTNGTGTVRIDAMDLNYFEITDAVFSSALMTVTSGELNVSMSFDMHIEVFIETNMERFTLNLVGQNNDTGDMLKYENLIEEDVYFPFVLSPTSYTQIVGGRQYDSEYGYVDIATPEITPLNYSAMEQVYPDSGVMLFTGANSNIRMTVDSATHVTIFLDSDGDQVYEIATTLLWGEIGNPIAADIGDNDGDGMHNSWETTYGLNPDDPGDALLDADSDGISNYQEYLDRTDPTTAILEVTSEWSMSGFGFNEPYRGQTFLIPQDATAQSLTVFVESGNTPIEFHILMVEVDTTTGFHPTNVLFESDTVALSASYGSEMTPITVNLGGIGLTANKAYAWLLDAFITSVPEHTDAATGADLSDSYPDGFQFSLHSGPFPLPGTREDHFASDAWFVDTGTDMTFKLEYSPVLDGI
ncbi:MAG: hypothetical protein WBM52_05350 [Thiogranum sp.]